MNNHNKLALHCWNCCIARARWKLVTHSVRNSTFVLFAPDTHSQKKKTFLKMEAAKPAPGSPRTQRLTNKSWKGEHFVGGEGSFFSKLLLESSPASVGRCI